MLLADPVTSMSSALVKGAAAQAQAHAAFAKSAPLAPRTTLRPVQIRQTPLAQTARHALPALLAGLFALRFRALVADPVSTMATTTLPLTAALQVAYAVWCLPAPGGPGTAAAGSAAGAGAQAGGGGGGGAAGAAGTAGTAAAKAGRKPRPGESSLRKRGAAESSGSSALTTAVLSLILSLLVTPFLYVAMILFGAPFLTHAAHTFLCAAHLAVLVLLPLFYVHGVDGSAWAVVGGFGAPLDETFGGLVGGLVGAWLGAVPIPLDWDRDWQKWPVTIMCGLYGGYVLGRVIGGTLAWGKSF
ncbi:GPI biosynthesis protein family Pig-F-domain-containing protein [Thermothelomyces heterothallicus CBS 202.75]|uniref:GPI biosynthesis protein family Pig-F-domain-containing protein n=1 Tax=Thermothelomyces heterothallicus CBS 202.75 TaxID=1149848 RepID=UPI003741EBFC